jgi:hypothetical protein
MLVGALGAGACFGRSAADSTPSEASVSAERAIRGSGHAIAADSPRFITGRHLRHYDIGVYGMVGSGKTTRLNSILVHQAGEEWCSIDPGES